MNYRLKIELKSDVCIGIGEGKGNSVDSDICIDRNGVPYIPARRIKGCLRSTADFLRECGYDLATEDAIKKLFGDPYGNYGTMVIDDAVMPIAHTIAAEVDEIRKHPEKAYLIGLTKPDAVEKCFTTVRGQTRLNNGIKIDNSLRFTRILLKSNPMVSDEDNLVFYANITVDDNQTELSQLLDACCKGTRHIGTNRNRGLGNVAMSIEECESKADAIVSKAQGTLDKDKLYTVEYRIRLDSSVTLPGCDEMYASIPSRSVIGCLGNYYMNNIGGEDFGKLFLDGSIKWSALTPVIKGQISVPTPSFINKLKNGNGRMINVLVQEDTSWKALKPRTIDGSFTSYDQAKNEFYVADVETHVRYHNSIMQKTLYMQESIDEGYIYGGTVTFPGDAYELILKLLTHAHLRFGRSRNIQYADCHLVSVSQPVMEEIKYRRLSGKVYVVLQSDMIINQNGVFELDNASIRSKIAEKLGLGESSENAEQDMVRYGIIGGFQNMWHLQKMHVPVIKSGSCFVFEAKDELLPDRVTTGSLSQEGFGLCKVYGYEELREMDKISRSQVDTVENTVEEKERGKLEKAYLDMLLKEVLQKYASDYCGSYDIPVGRIRTMLDTATDFEDFLRKVETIKESDANSQNVGRKEKVKKLIADFYGENGFDWQVLLNANPDIFKALMSDPETEKQLREKYWRLPLWLLLKRLHYEGSENK